MLSHENITLRAVEPDDLEFLYSLENEIENWLVSQTFTPFSRQTLGEYVTSIHDISIQKQLRLIITQDGKNVGAVDLFEYDPINARAGVGVLVVSDKRGQGIAKTALELTRKYAFDVLHLTQLWCNISSNNDVSQKLFEYQGYVKCGTKLAWTKTTDGWIDEHMYQLQRK